MSEADLMASRMRENLSKANDPKATLARFVTALNQREAAVLRAALEDDQSP